MARADGKKLLSVQNNGDEWAFTWAQGNDAHSLKSNETPLPQLRAELEKATAYALDIMPYIQNGYHDRFTAFGIKMDDKRDDGGRNAIVKLAFKSGSDGVQRLSSPKRMMNPDLDEKKKNKWSRDASTQFMVIEQEAFRYLDGERAQQVMTLDGDETKGKKGKAAKNAEKNIENELGDTIGAA